MVPEPTVMNATVPLSDPQWFAIRVRSNYERRVAESLRMKGIEQFLPLYRRRSRWTDRMREIEQPLFRGYVFSRIHVERRLPVLQVPGVVGIVGHGRTPQPIDEIEISAIARVVAASLSAEPWPYLRVGDAVRVDRGPLEGLEGFLVAMKKPARLIISVTLLQRAVAVEIDEHWVTPLSTSRAPVAAGSGRLSVPARATARAKARAGHTAVPEPRSA